EPLPITGSEGISGNGQYRIRYTKVGSEIEFYGGGQRFWKQKSMEYPYLSHSGRLIFMLNGDQSAARVIDLNGNEIGIKTIAGRVCTVISFAEHEDFGGAGFLDGSFQAVKADGGGIAAGRVSDGGMVKSMAISDNGRFVVVHGGNTKQDHIEIHHTGTGKSYTRSIDSVHISKTPIHAANDGRVVVLDKSAMLFLDEKAKVDFTIPLDEKRDGHASIKEGAAAYALGYTTRRGLARFLLIAKNGNIICQRDFPGESFLDIAFEKELIFLRGSDNLYCYSLHEKAE
ncbi:MAG: hypothetical protein LBT84_07385, partial [Spirochaetia bacterium]|nr:hypothetical protein [Spirochaetia bacterium]